MDALFTTTSLLQLSFIMTTDCRLLNIAIKLRQAVSSFMAIQDQVKRMEPILMEQYNFFVDQEKVATNVMSKGDISFLMESFKILEVLLANMKKKLKEIQHASYEMQGSLITLYQLQNGKKSTKV